METLTILAICLGVYLLWKLNAKAQSNKRAARIEAEIRNSIQSIINLGNSQADEGTIQTQITKSLLTLIRNIEAIRGEESIMVGSFAHNYLLAAADDDTKYIGEANIRIARQIIKSNSQDECISVILEFLLRPPQPEFIYTNGNSEAVPTNYSAQFMSDVDSLLKTR